MPSVAILTVAAVIRWHGLGTSSLWLDELGQVHAARAPLDELLATVRSHAGAAPLDYLATKVTMLVAGPIVGTVTISARLWPWLCGVATVWATERTTLELTGSRRAALAAATLTALSAFLVYYSQEARFYSLSVLLAVVIVWTFARATRLRRRRDWVAFAFAAIAGVYTFYFIALLLVLEGVGLLVTAGVKAARRRPIGPALIELGRRIFPLALICLATVLAFMPWYLYAARTQMSLVWHYQVVALSPPRLASLMATLLAAVPRAGVPGGDSWTDWLLTAAVLALAVPGAIRLVRARPETATAMVSLAILLIPVVWAIDVRSQYFVTERQFILLLPMLYILAAVGLDGAVSELQRLLVSARFRAPQAIGRLALFGLAIALVSLSIGPLGRVYAGSFTPKEDWRGAAAFAEKMVCPGGHVYSNLSPGYDYGIGIYAPSLMSRTVYVRESGFLLDRLKKYPLEPQDIVVVLVAAPGVSVPGRGTIGTISDWLRSEGFFFHDIDSRIRVFYDPEGCQAAPVKKLVVSGLTTPRAVSATGSIRVTAVDAYGDRAPAYRGTVHFTSTDAKARLPADYTFTAADEGTHVFSGDVILETVGRESVNAIDTATAAIAGAQTNVVVTPT
jgi:hypothetical protein